MLPFVIGSFLQLTGDVYYVHKETSSKIVAKVSLAIARMGAAFIYFSKNEEKIRFNNIYKVRVL